MWRGGKEAESSIDLADFGRDFKRIRVGPAIHGASRQTFTTELGQRLAQVKAGTSVLRSEAPNSGL
jgi:hypothetical protein